MLRSIPVPFGIAAAGAALLAACRPLWLESTSSRAGALLAAPSAMTIAAFALGAVLFAIGVSMVAVEATDRALWTRREPDAQGRDKGRPARTFSNGGSRGVRKPA
jgi:hypothetical protein